jgi:hypothetical protein
MSIKISSLAFLSFFLRNFVLLTNCLINLLFSYNKVNTITINAFLVNLY